MEASEPSTGIGEEIGEFPKFISPLEAVKVYQAIDSNLAPLEEDGSVKTINWCLAGSIGIKLLVYELAKREVEGVYENKINGEKIFKGRILKVADDGKVVEQREVELERPSVFPLIFWREVKDIDIIGFTKNGRDLSEDSIKKGGKIDNIFELVSDVRKLLGKEYFELLEINGKFVLHPSFVLAGVVLRALSGGGSRVSREKRDYQIFREPQEVFELVEALFPGEGENTLRKTIRSLASRGGENYSLHYILDYPSESRVRQIILEETQALRDEVISFFPGIDERFVEIFGFQLYGLKRKVDEMDRSASVVQEFIKSFFEGAEGVELNKKTKEKIVRSLRNLGLWVFILKDNPNYLETFVKNLKIAASTFPIVNPSIGWVFLFEGMEDVVKGLVENDVQIDNFLSLRVDQSMVADPTLIDLDVLGLGKEIYKKKFLVLLEKFKRLTEDDKRRFIEEFNDILQRKEYILGSVIEFVEDKFREFFGERSH